MSLSDNDNQILSQFEKSYWSAHFGEAVYKRLAEEADADLARLAAEVERLRDGIEGALLVRHLDHDCAACEMHGLLVTTLLNPTERDDRRALPKTTPAEVPARTDDAGAGPGEEVEPSLSAPSRPVDPDAGFLASEELHREVAARAWDEGYHRACVDHGGLASCGKPDGHRQSRINPYRAGGE